MDSPKIKGSAFISAITVLEGYDVLRKNLPDYLQHYLEEPMIQTKYYPEKDWYDMLQFMFDAMPSTDENMWEVIGRRGAQRDAAELDTKNLDEVYQQAVRKAGEGLYRNLLRKGNPLKSLKSLTSLWKLYHDQGQRIIKEISPGHALIELKNYTPPGPHYCSLLTGYHLEWMNLAGAQKCTITHSKCVLRGDASCIWNCRWAEEQHMQEVANEIETDEEMIKCPSCGWINSKRRSLCSSCKEELS